MSGFVWKIEIWIKSTSHISHNSHIKFPKSVFVAKILEIISNIVWFREALCNYQTTINEIFIQFKYILNPFFDIKSTFTDWIKSTYLGNCVWICVLGGDWKTCWAYETFWFNWIVNVKYWDRRWPYC